MPHSLVGADEIYKPTLKKEIKNDQISLTFMWGGDKVATVTLSKEKGEELYKLSEFRTEPDFREKEIRGRTLLAIGMIFSGTEKDVYKVKFTSMNEVLAVINISASGEIGFEDVSRRNRDFRKMIEAVERREKKNKREK